MARFTNVVKNRGSAQFAGVVDEHVAKTEDSLRNTGRNGDVLNLAEWNITGSAGDQTGINLNFSVSQRIPDHVSSQVVKGRNQKERQRQRY